MNVRLSSADRLVRRERIARAVEAGAHPGQVSLDEGVSISTVIRACVERGVPVSQAQGQDRRNPSYAIIADLLLTDDSYGIIAKRHGVSRQRVHQVCGRLRAVGLCRLE